MRRIDIARKVMMGGLANPRTTTGTQKLTGEASPSNRTFKKVYDGTNTLDGSGGDGVTPYDDGTYTYVVDTGEFKVYQGNTLKATYAIVVEKVAADEPNDFEDLGAGPTTVGVFQRYGNQARWGNMWFNDNGYDGKNNGNGGFISNPITDNITSNFINDLQNTAADTWTPLAEAYYTGVMYYAQDAIDGSLNYANNPGTTLGDPFDNAAYCAKNFMIIVTDGASTMDGKIPSSIKDYADAYDDFVAGDEVAGDCDETTSNGCEYSSGGTDYLKDVALWARTTDLRPDSDADGLDADQNVSLYTIYAFGNEDNARNLLKEAAKNGGFKDQDGDNVPDGTQASDPEDRKEWDDDGDGVPDTYFEASSGRDLEKELGKAIRDILERAASGTAASVLATNSEGEGNLVQAYFRPTYTTTTTKKNAVEASWSGYLQSLWVDHCGLLREDANGNRKLDIQDTGEGIDPIIEYFFDASTSDTKIKRYSAHPRYSTPYYCDDPGVSTDYDSATVDLNTIEPLFESGRLLALANPDDRTIFTYIDDDEDGVVDGETPYDHNDDQGELIAFSSTNSAALTPYLGLVHSDWDYLGTSHAERVSNLIDYVRGTDLFDANGDPVLRNRTSNEIDGLDDDDLSDGIDYVWKLGDIVHSTPISVSKPSDNFHHIYSDESYQYFFDYARNRETVVYVGANDGMLHAFTSWKYDSSAGEFKYPITSPAYNAYDTTPGMQLGSELWAYIPQTLLPHLKFLADPDYTHVYYVDMKPKVFDAKILQDNKHYSDPDADDDWGTFLLIGLNLGGKRIWTNEFGASGTDTRYFDPTYILMDVTDPRNPELIWERSYTGLGLSQSTPAIVKVEDQWFAVFGSGPTDYDGTSVQNAKIFVVDLKTGAPYTNGTEDWLFELNEDYAFLNSPAALDKGLNYSVDAIYFGETYCASATCESPKQFEGMIYKLPVKCDPCEWDATVSNPVAYEDDPTLWPSPSVLMEIDAPVTAPLALSVDYYDNGWVYFGTGRYLRDEDKISQNQEYLIGLKDPFYNEDYNGTYYHNFASTKTLQTSDLFVADDIAVTTSGNVFKASTGQPYGGALATSNWGEMLGDARAKDGWIRSLEVSSGPSERVVSKSSILGGIVLTPSYTPNDDICGFGGMTGFYGLYYETGTPFTKNVFTWDGQTINYASTTYKKVNAKLNASNIGAPPPGVGIHAGREGGAHGAKAFLQLSTGEIAAIDVETALPIKSNLTNWREVD